MTIGNQEIKGAGSYSFYTGGLCRDCNFWDTSKGYETGQCAEIVSDMTKKNDSDNRVRVYSDSAPISTEPCFGCNHFLKKQDTIEGEICNSCGKKATIFDVDPFSHEIWPEEENEEEWWCDECYDDRLAEI